MRLACLASLGLGMVAAAGCMREPAGPTWDFDEQADAAEAQAFLDQWRSLAKENDPRSQVARASLAWQVLSNGFWRKVPGLTEAALESQGLQDAESAAQALPNNPEPLRLVAQLKLRNGDLAGATQAACRAADCTPPAADDLETCGDLLRRSGDGPGAVERYQKAVLASTEPIQRFELIRRIEETSLQPSADLGSLPLEVVEQYQSPLCRCQAPPP